ncbi:methylamine utilization protein MauE [Ancylobacter sp. 6x-1]|uniref:Methylamine utilization protein MauE n=1 Tax=Ancylobacter crimeensis TaxID=2579147 RepID=A0ABT0DD70_9HYPH|nr:MauE/DoxX family redox-associated membrane protein [Ancylobacter crimeensis]MCK0197909.1 methylamine utilization protein MauE [Ancylobacter crimeensis]
MSILAEPVISIFLRSFLILLFAGAAFSKLRHGEEFFGVVRNFRLMPEWLARPFAAALPWVELATAIGLAVPATAAHAASVAGLLLALFGVAIGINVWRGRTAIDCGCFRGGLKQSVSGRLVLRNAVLAAMAFALAVSVPLGRAPDPLELGLGVVAAALAMLLYLSASLLGHLQGARSNTSLFSKG